MIHDITLPIHLQMLVWPKDPAPFFETIQTIETDGNQSSLIHMNSHCGTHIDAPKHFVKGAGSVDEIDPTIFVGPAHVIEIHEKRQEISAEDLKNAMKNSPFPARLLLKTQNSRMRLLQQEKFYEDFTALTPDAADFLVTAGIQLIGVDYLSCENPKTSGAWEVHKKLLSAGVVIVESCNLSEVPAGAYQLIALPLKLRGLDGSPCRALLIA